MIIVLSRDIRPADKQALTAFLEGKGFRLREIQGEQETVLGAVGIVPIDVRQVELLPGVARIGGRDVRNDRGDGGGGLARVTRLQVPARPQLIGLGPLPRRNVRSIIDSSLHPAATMKSIVLSVLAILVCGGLGAFAGSGAVSAMRLDRNRRGRGRRA